MRIPNPSRRQKLVLVMAVVLGVISGTMSPAAAVVSTKPVSNTYFGISVPNAKQETIDAQSKMLGKRPSIISDYRDWAHHPNFPMPLAQRVHAQNATLMLTWEPFDNTRGVDQPDYRLWDIIHGAHDAHIRRWAQQIDAWGKPLYLRFAHEMNGNWYPWAEKANGNEPGEFVRAWRHVHDIFREEGATNVAWVWSPNVNFGGSTPLKSLYPGDKYVYWTALDGYNFGDSIPGKRKWKWFDQIFQPSIDEIRSFTHKPMMIAETGSVESGGDKDAWIKNFFREMEERPYIHAFVWFDHSKNQDWRINTSSASRYAFKTSIQSNKYIGA